MENTTKQELNEMLKKGDARIVTTTGNHKGNYFISKTAKQVKLTETDIENAKLAAKKTGLDIQE